MRAYIVTIGDEILIGQIIDTNAVKIAKALNLNGIQVLGKTTVGDGHDDITKAFDMGFSKADIIITTGGLGPTKDDITKKAIADYFGEPMEYDEAVFARIEGFFKKIGRKTTALHQEQAFMPKGVNLLQNDMGTAPGMWMEKNGKVVISMPGVPYEMEFLLEHRVLPKLKEHFGSKPIVHRTLRTSGYGETALAEKIGDIEEGLPANIKLAYLPNLGEVRLRLSAFGEVGDSEEELMASVNQHAEAIKARLEHRIYGEGDDNMQAAVGRILLEKGLHLATAESCTGGSIASKIVEIPGSSAYFKGGIVAYSNEVKMKTLGVSPDTLKNHGAVSEQTVKEMVKGTISHVGADIAIAVSGIAGPTGGSAEKPVGTIWVAVGSKDKVKTKLIRAGKDRLKNIEYASKACLNLIRLFLIREM